MTWKPKEERVCIDCGKQGVHKRRRCLECVRKYNRQRAKVYYHRGVCGISCANCGNVIKRPRQGQLLCSKCARTSTSTTPIKSCGDYVYIGGLKENGSEWEHRIIASFLISRSLESGEAVHHINEDPEDNSFTNMIVTSRSLHSSLHAQLRNQRNQLIIDNDMGSWPGVRVCFTLEWISKHQSVEKLWELADKYPERVLALSKRLAEIKEQRKAKEELKIKRSKALCKQCGEVFLKIGSRNQTYCSLKCAGAVRRKVERPSRDQLAKLVWSMPTTKVAKSLGVSDVAVAKWCKLYGVEKPPRGYWAQQLAGSTPAT